MKSNGTSALPDDERLHQAIYQQVRDISSNQAFNRRQFLKLAGLAGGGFAIAIIYPPKALATGRMADLNATAVSTELSAFVHIREDGKIVILAKNPEIGQGVKTSLPMIVAEELEADWDDVIVRQSPVDSAKFGMHLAGGSLSVSMNWERLRRAGAMARTLLVSAAASKWAVPESECEARLSKVTHLPTGRSFTFGELAKEAATLPLPDAKSLTLKPSGEFRLLGKRISGVDNPAIVTGKPLFGIDVDLPGLVYAAFVKCPREGGKALSFNQSEIRQQPGINDAFIMQARGGPTAVKSGVVIIGQSTWHVFRARRMLTIEWDYSEASSDSWSQLVTQANNIANQVPQHIYYASGEPAAALAQANTTVNSFYTFGFVGHANLEPQNCTAVMHENAIEFWAPTQAPDWGIKQVAELLALPPENIKVNQTRVGGGFGRRLLNDYMCEVALIAKRLTTPVKLVWSREDDFQHDFFRPAGFNAVHAGLDENGELIGWSNHLITFTHDGEKPVMGGGYLFPDTAQYEFPSAATGHYQHGYSMLPLKTMTGAWRAPFTNTFAWVTQSVLHELSTASAQDHRDFLLRLLGQPRWLVEGNQNLLHTGRAGGVIRLAANKAGWGRQEEPGRALGLAFHFCHGGHFAICADVSVDDSKKVTIHHITCVGDIGPIVNLSGAEHQCQGAVLDGLSTMLDAEIHIENGTVKEQNFHQYPLLRIGQVPPVEVHFIEGDYTPSGAGEPALPPVAPAICNAIYSVTGIRINTMPISRQGFRL